MASLPVFQELSTVAMVMGDLICGDKKKAKERVEGYYEQSVLGSLAAGTVETIAGNHDDAKKFFKGCGRATGRAICGGGLLENVPVFHEVSTIGKSLGEVIARDPENIEKHVDNYAENSVIGSFVGACVADSAGNYERRDRLLKNSGKALISATATTATMAATALTGGAAAPLGMGAAATTGGVMGAASSVLAQTTNDFLYNDGKFSSGGDYVGGALFGGTLGAISGAQMADAYQQQETALLDAERMENHKDLLKGFKEEHDQFTSTTIHDKDNLKSSHGYSRALRNKFEDGKDLSGKPLYKDPNAKVKLMVKKSEYGNTEGSLSYPKGYRNVEKAFKHRKVQAKLNEIGRESWDVQNCAEPHALETFKANSPQSKVDASYTLEVKNGHEYIKKPCRNCQAMGEVNAYGRVPFEKYDGMPVDQAINKHVTDANNARCATDMTNRMVNARNVTVENDDRDEDEDEDKDKED